MNELQELIREQRAITAALRATVAQSKMIARNSTVHDTNAIRHVFLLRMAEALIEAHKAAKIDGEGTTLDYIEDALRHVGERLAKENGDGRDFRRKRVGPL